MILISLTIRSNIVYFCTFLRENCIQKVSYQQSAYPIVKTNKIGDISTTVVTLENKWLTC